MNNSTEENNAFDEDERGKLPSMSLSITSDVQL